MVTRGTNGCSPTRLNILILCMDQRQTYRQVPDAMEFPANRCLKAQDVSFNRHCCTYPVCTTRDDVDGGEVPYGRGRRPS